MALIRREDPGFRLIGGSRLNQIIDIINGIVQRPAAIRLSSQDAIVANPGGGQANATLLSASVNRIGTVATINDSVKLPPSLPGTVLFLTNGAANSSQVFGSGTDTINDVATATGVALAAGKTAIYSCPVAGKWYANLSA